MSILDEVIAANQHFITHLPVDYSDEDSGVSKLPKRHLAIVTCMDTRLVDFLEGALGIGRGQAKIIKNAGNTVTGPFEATIRSLLVSVFELGVQEIMVIGHHDCGIAHVSSQGLVDKMLKRGIPEAAIRMIRGELENWIDNFHNPMENIEQVVDKIRTNPLIPEDVPVHGLIFDPKSGKLDIVVDGYKGLKNRKATAKIPFCQQSIALVQLIRIDQNNRDDYRTFDSVYHDHLTKFQSRIYPRDDAELLNWYYIQAGSNLIGSLWLEKQANESFAVLGIFIADEEYRGKGIGKQAIDAIIRADAKEMKVNEVRLNVREENKRAIQCYVKCGFAEMQRYTTEEGITVIGMSYSV